MERRAEQHEQEEEDNGLQVASLIKEALHDRLAGTDLTEEKAINLITFDQKEGKIKEEAKQCRFLSQSRGNRNVQEPEGEDWNHCCGWKVQDRQVFLVEQDHFGQI